MTAVPMAQPQPSGSVLPMRPLVVGRFLGTVIVTLHGDLDATASAGLARVLHDLIEGQGNLDVAVNLRDVRWIGESGVKALAAAAKRLSARGGELRMGGPSATVLATLSKAGLAALVTVALDDDRRHGQSPRPSPVSASDQLARDSHPSGDGWYRPVREGPDGDAPRPHPGWETAAGHHRHPPPGDDG